MNGRPRLLDVGAAAHMRSGGVLAGGSGQWAVGRHAQVDMPDCTTTDTCIGKHATARDGLGASSSPDVGKTMAAFGSARDPSADALAAARKTMALMAAGTEHPDGFQKFKPATNRAIPLVNA